MWNSGKFGFAFHAVSRGKTVQRESEIPSQGFVKKSCEIWIQWLCCDFAYFWISSLLTSASKHRYANACWHISCIYEAKHKSDKELALAMPVRLRSTIYSFFRTWVNDMSDSAFNLQHLGLLRHVKTINFLKTMKIISSQYVFVHERSLRRRSFVCFNFQPLFKQWENIQNSLICLQWDAQNKTSLVIDL